MQYKYDVRFVGMDNNWVKVTFAEPEIIEKLLNYLKKGKVIVHSDDGYKTGIIINYKHVAYIDFKETKE